MPTAQPTMRPILDFFSGAAEGEEAPVGFVAAGWVMVLTIVVGPAVPVDTEVERVVTGVLASFEEVLSLGAESLVAEAEVDAAVDDGELLPPPPPETLPVMVARFGALEPVLPPIVPYALGSCNAKKGRGTGFCWQQSTSTRFASQHQSLS
jgi:hypothetical protein